MDEFRDFQEKAVDKMRSLTMDANYIVATRLDQAERPEDFAEERYSIQSVSEEISIIDKLLNLPKNRLYLRDTDRYRLRLRQNRDQSHVLLNDQKFSGDSTRMTLVKDAIFDLEKCLARTSNGLTAENLREAEGLYNTALTRCQEYIDNKNPWFAKGKERLRMVENAKIRLTEEKRQVEAVKGLLEKNSHALDGATCVREVLLKGQAELDKVKVDANAKAPENLSWDDFASVATGKLKGGITYSDNGLKETSSDKMSVENRKIKERLIAVISGRLGKDAFSKDLELRLRSRLGINNTAFESAPLSKLALREIYDMISDNTTLVSSILSKDEPAEAEKPEENFPAVYYALAKAVDKYIGTKEEAISSSKTFDESLKNTRDELLSLMKKAKDMGAAVPPLTQEQLNWVALSNMGKLRDAVFSQLEDVYSMAIVISGGDYSLYKTVAADEELVIKISSFIITKIATTGNPWDELLTNTELALLKQQMAFSLASKKKEEGQPEGDAPSPMEQLKDNAEKMSRLQDLSSLGGKGLDACVKENETLKNADAKLKAGITALKSVADNLRLLNEFEKDAIKNGVETDPTKNFMAGIYNNAKKAMAQNVKKAFYKETGELDTEKISAMEQVANALAGTRFATGFAEAKKLLVDERFDILAYVEGLINNCKKVTYKKAVYTKPEAFKDKTTEEQDKLLLGFDKRSQLILSAFMMRDDFSKLISSKKDNAAKDIAHVKDVLKTFKQDEASVADVSIGSTKFTLIQKENNDLYIIMDHKRIPLSFSAPFLVSQIEQSITKNTHLYGKNERNNVLKDADNASEDDDMLTLRSLYINVLSREAKCTTEELSHLALSDLRVYSKSLVDGSMTGDAIKADVRAKYNSAVINGAEALDIMRMVGKMDEETIKSMVVYSEEKKEQVKKEKKNSYRKELIEERPWTPDELEVKNFITDLIFSEETWKADNVLLKPGMRLYELIKKNSTVIAKLAMNRSMLQGVLNKLPLPGETLDSIDGNGPQLEIKKQIMQSMDDFLDTEVIANIVTKAKNTNEKIVKEEVDGKVVEKKVKITNEEKIKSISGSLGTLMFMMKDKDIAEFKKIEDNIDKAVTEAVDSIQETTLTLAKEMFGEDENTEYRYQEQPKRMFQDLLYSPSIIENADDPEALAVALRNLLKKHSGGVIQCMHKPGMIKDYLDEVPEPEKREEKEKFHAAKKIIATAIENFGKALKAHKSGILKGHSMETMEDKEHNIRSNHEVRLKLENLLENSSEELLADLLVDVKNIAKSLREELKDPKEPGITKDEKKKRIEAGGKRLDKIIAQTASGDRGQGKFIKLIFSNYFKNVSVQDKRAMLASAIRGAKSLKVGDSYADKDRKQSALDSAISKNYIGGFLKGAGPLLQKLLQGMPTAMLPPELKTAVEDMKSNLSPIPEKIVQAQMIAIVKGSKGKIKKIQIDKSLGAASVGQAFLCRLFGPGLPENGKEVVIKLLRPDVRNRMLREKAVMLDCAEKTDKNHGMRDTYEGMLERIEEELDLTMEATNVKKGEIYNSADKKVETMKLSDIIAPSPTVMVMERAPGITLDQYIRDTNKEINDILDKYIQKENQEPKLYSNGAFRFKLSVDNIGETQADREFLAKKLEELRKRQSYLIEMSKKWVQEGVFGKGFYHGDLHSGNIMISDEKATVIDFGNATTLTSDQQTQIIRMISAAAVGDWKGFRSGYHALLPKDREEIYQRNKEQLGEAFREVFELGDFRFSGQRIGAALLRAQEMGLQLPAAIQNFSQCQLRLQNSVNELNEQIEKIQLNLSSFDCAETSSVDVNPEIILRDHYSKRDDIYMSNFKLKKELQRIAVPGEEEYKDFSKLLESKEPEQIKEFENSYTADYEAMRTFASDIEFMKGFYDSIKKIKSKDERKTLLEGEKKDDYQKCLDMYKKHGFEISLRDFKKVFEDPDAYTRDFEHMFYLLEKKAERITNAGVPDTYKNLLDEYRNLQQNPDTTPEVLEEKRKALFEEYKKMREHHFKIYGPFSDAVEKLTVMPKTYWEKGEASGYAKELKPLFEDKDCKGEELRNCYNKYAEKIKELEAIRQAEEDELMEKAENNRERAHIRVERKDTEESIRLRNEFLAAYRETVTLRLKKMIAYNKDYGHLNNQSAPENFLDVMGEVIRDNLTSAIYKLGKYAWKYRKDLAAQNN